MFTSEVTHSCAGLCPWGLLPDNRWYVLHISSGYFLDSLIVISVDTRSLPETYFRCGCGVVCCLDISVGLGWLGARPCAGGLGCCGGNVPALEACTGEDPAADRTCCGDPGDLCWGEVDWGLWGCCPWGDSRCCGGAFVHGGWDPCGWRGPPGRDM